MKKIIILIFGSFLNKIYANNSIYKDFEKILCPKKYENANILINNSNKIKAYLFSFLFDKTQTKVPFIKSETTYNYCTRIKFTLLDSELLQKLRENKATTTEFLNERFDIILNNYKITFFKKISYFNQNFYICLSSLITLSLTIGSIMGFVGVVLGFFFNNLPISQ